MPWNKEQRLAWRLAHPKWKRRPRTPEASRRNYLRHKDKTIQQNWVRQIASLGCTPEMYWALADKQDGLCAICLGENGAKKKLAVDHDHITGKVRGLLCNSCNTALGVFDDDPEMLKRALEYLCRTTK